MAERKVLFLVPYPLKKAPSQRFRVEAFLPFLLQNGISYTIKPFLNEQQYQLLYEPASVIKKAIVILVAYVKRLFTVLFSIYSYDFVFIHREATPLGPPVIEFLISKIFRKKIIYDFDDAIWIPNVSRENRLANWGKAFWKIKYICKWSYKVVGGNDYLCNHARKYNEKVILIPTCVDVEGRHNKIKEHKDKDVITIGWTGSHSTLPFLDKIVSVLKEINLQKNTSFLVICNKPPAFALNNLTFIKWSENTEIEDLLLIDIGVMPLEEDAWCEGKCGFKLIQYLALGIPAVASPVGVNKKIIQPGVNGFLCTTSEEWYDSLNRLIKDSDLRMNFGKAGHSQIRENYSIQGTAADFISLFKR